MQIINALIPNFECEAEEQVSKKTAMHHPERHQRQPSNVGAMRLPSNPFVNSLTQEYTIEEELPEKEQDSSPKPWEDLQAELAKAKQKTPEFSFEGGMLQASLSKTDASGMESLLAKAVLEHFTHFSLTKYEMTVDLLLRHAPKKS